MKRNTISDVGPQAKAQAMLITLKMPMVMLVTWSRPQRSAAQPAISAPMSWPKNAADSTNPICRGFIFQVSARTGRA